jgi:hypothetical protein
MRPAAKSGRPDFFFGFSNRIVMAPLSTVSHMTAFTDVRAPVSDLGALTSLFSDAIIPDIESL